MRGERLRIHVQGVQPLRVPPTWRIAFRLQESLLVLLPRATHTKRYRQRKQAMSASLPGSMALDPPDSRAREPR
jgi:hypothetical protein